MDKGDLEREFALRKYELDRAHELELNKFTHAFEMEQAKLLFILNGAAFTILISLLQWKGGGGEGLKFIPVAGWLWLLGIFAATVAGLLALAAQRQFTRAYHNRRRALETTFGIFDVVSESGQRTAPAEFLNKADEARKMGKKWSDLVPISAFASMIAFFGGGLAALAYVRLAVAAG